MAIILNNAILERLLWLQCGEHCNKAKSRSKATRTEDITTVQKKKPL